MAAKTNGHPPYRNDRIREAMEALGFKDQDVSNGSGLAILTIQHLRLGKAKDPRLSTIDKAAGALNVSRIHLLEPWPAKKAAAKGRT